MTFVDLILKHTSESESPRRYWYWSALVSISAVVSNKVYLDMHLHKLFPNIYCILVGRSGLRKGPPVALATRLVDAVDNTRVIQGRSSIQAIITDLSTAMTKENGGPPLTDAIGFISSDEFAAFLVQDPQAMTILTQLYDTHYRKEWVNRTKVSGRERLKNPCITLFGASNEVHIKDALPENAMTGGFLARTFIIYADKKAGINPLTEKPKHLIPFDQLLTPLMEISKLKGEFKWSEAGKQLYEAWYSHLQNTEMSDDETGTMERVHDHVVKTSMLVSLSRKTDLRLEYEDVEEAIRACQDFVPGARRVALGQVGNSISAPGTSVLLRALIAHPQNRMSRTEALQHHWRHFDASELDRIAESLHAQKAITLSIERDPETGKPDANYILNPNVLKRLNKVTD